MILKKTKPFGILTGVFSTALTILIVGTSVANSYASMINKQFGIKSSKIVKGEGSDENTNYYQSDYLKADGTLDGDALTKWQKELCEQIQGEGTVLVENKSKAPSIKVGSRYHLLWTFIS